VLLRLYVPRGCKRIELAWTYIDNFGTLSWTKPESAILMNSLKVVNLLKNVNKIKITWKTNGISFFPIYTFHFTKISGIKSRFQKGTWKNSFVFLSTAISHMNVWIYKYIVIVCHTFKHFSSFHKNPYGIYTKKGKHTRNSGQLKTVHRSPFLCIDFSRRTILRMKCCEENETTSTRERRV